MKKILKGAVVTFGEFVTILDIAMGFVIGELTKALLLNKGDMVTFLATSDYTGFVYGAIGVYFVLRVIYKILSISLEKESEIEKSSKTISRRPIRFVRRRLTRRGRK